MPGWNTHYRDRADAGRTLAARLRSLRDQPLVIGLPRGGVVVALEVALAREAPLDVLVTRKLGAPPQPEWAVGAIAPGGALYLSTDYQWDEEQLARVVARERREMQRRLDRYEEARPALDVAGRTVILVDDGIATGMTVFAALQALRQAGVGRLVLAVPVCPYDTAAQMRTAVDAFVCPLTPRRFLAVGEWYERFDPVSDEVVIACLETARAQRTPDAEEGTL